VRMWELAGCEVVQMDVEKHDRVLAAVSHLPHMVAYTLVNAVGGYDRFNESILHYSAGGFRDFTRIASSDPAMWRDIALMNRDGILEMMDYFIRYFTELRELVDRRDDEGIQKFFTQSKEQRDGIIDVRKDVSQE
jgi:prephenate dehydrogenase